MAAAMSPVSMSTNTNLFFMRQSVNEFCTPASLAHNTAEVRMAFQSLKGQLLLDNGRLQGSFFHRTVLLICQHDCEGAFGLVLNRKTGNKVGDALTANMPDTLKEQELFLGGPVQPQALSYLHSDTFLPDANVMTNLSLDHSLDNLLDLGESFSPSQQIKVFAGYAGW